MADAYKRWVMLLLGMVPLAALSAGGNALPVASLKSNPFNERFLDNVPVSGMVLVGVAPIGIKNKDVLAVYVPPNTQADSLCVQVLTRDGRYWSKNEYALTPTQAQGGYVRLAYPSRYMDTLRKEYGDDRELAVLAYLGSCQSAVDYKNILMAGMVSNNPVQPGPYLALVNSGRSDVSIRLKSQSASTVVRCNRIEEGKRTGFDTVCELSNLDEVTEIQIVRRQFDRVLPPVSFTLRVTR